MPSGKNILILDAGTTGIKAFVFDENEQLKARVNEALEKTFPQPGFVEQDPSVILEAAKRVMRAAIQQSGLSVDELDGVGVTNQRETIVAWRTANGKALYPAIVWEDARTKDWCDSKSALSSEVKDKTGLPIDPYFSATKIRWLLDNVSDVREALKDQKLAIGTIDTWLMWNLLEGHPHLTDETNAARTLLYNIKTRQLDDRLLQIFDITRQILPEVKRSRSFFGKLSEGVVGKALPLIAVCGDQQSSMYAAGAEIGTTKVTYGTGTFIAQVIGSDFAIHDPFFTTIIPSEDNPIYAVEAKIDRGGPDVEPLLGHQEKLDEFLTKLVQDVGSLVDKLPIKPKEIIIDGGVTRAPIVAKLHPEMTGALVRQHKIFDATALGTARLAKEFLTKNPQ